MNPKTNSPVTDAVEQWYKDATCYADNNPNSDYEVARQAMRKHAENSRAFEVKLASFEWHPIDEADRTQRIWAYNGEQGVMRWSEGDEWALWIWDDSSLSNIDPSPVQPTHYRQLPEPPTVNS